MKSMKLILKIGGYVMIVMGVACLVAGYFDNIKALVPCKRKEKAPEEFADFADIV